MRDINASGIVINAFDNGFDWHAGVKAVTRMGDAGNGNAVNGKQGNDAAADVHKCAKRFEMRDLGVDDVAGDKVHEKIFKAVLLRGTSGKDGDCFPIFGFKADDFEGDRLADAGDHSDILDFLAGNIVNGFAFGNFAFHAAEIHIERKGRVAERRLRFKNFAGCRRLFQRTLCVAALARLGADADKSFRFIHSLVHNILRFFFLFHVYSVRRGFMTEKQKPA